MALSVRNTDVSSLAVMLLLIKFVADAIMLVLSCLGGSCLGGSSRTVAVYISLGLSPRRLMYWALVLSEMLYLLSLSVILEICQAVGF